MNVISELILRSVGIFSGVFFTLGWAIKSPLEYDEMYTVGVIICAIIAAHYKYN